MRVYEIGDQTGLDGLTLSERPDPTPGPGEVVLKVLSVCLNHRDLLVLAGTYGAKKPADRVPLSDGVGEVIAVGDGVTTLGIGDRAATTHFVNWIDGAFSMAYFGVDVGITRDGWLAERIVLPAASLVKIPDGIGDERAAPLPAAGVTAWNAVVEVGKVKAGDVVLALGTGGVSIFALQIAKASGARVAITSSSDEKLAQARALGADITINYRTQPDWAAALMAETGGKGADIIVETGGQATLSQSIAAAATNGRIVLIGALGGAGEAIPNFSTIIGKNLTLRGITEGSRAMLAALVQAIDANAIQPVINRTFSFEEAPAAYRWLKSGEHVGKVMIRVAAD